MRLLAKLSEYFQYDDSSLVIWRDGSENDPYIDKSDTLRIVNNRAVLDEIPDPYSKVKIYDITGYPADTDWSRIDLKMLPPMIEIDTKIFNAPKTPNLNQYIVNYANGIITFHPDLNGKDRLAVYKGRGKIIISASRIWVNSDVPYAVTNLQEYIDLCDQRIKEVDEAILLCSQATIDCRNATEKSIETTNLAKEATADCIKTTEDSLLATENCIKATEEAVEATTEAKKETQNMYVDRMNTRKIYRPPVSSYAEIRLEYPHPEVGYTVMTRDNGNVYRWNGSAWVFIENFTSATPLADETMDGLMSKDMVYKLNRIETEAQKNLIGEDAKDVLPTYFKKKTMVFVLNEPIFRKGIQDVILQFPCEGLITNVQAFCKQAGITNTIMAVEKISNADYIARPYMWSNIFVTGSNIVFDYSSTVGGNYQLNDPFVKAGDYFRINMLEAGDGIKSITVQVDVEI